MINKESNYGVLLFDEGWKELEEALKPYVQKGPIGNYLYCKKLKNSGNFLELTFTPQQVNNRILDEMSIWIPVSYVKFVATSTEENASKIGFV